MAQNDRSCSRPSKVRRLYMDSCLPEAVAVGNRGNRVEDERSHVISRSGTALHPRARLRSCSCASMAQGVHVFKSLCFGCTVLHRRSTSCRNKEAHARNKHADPISSNMPNYTHVPHMQCMMLNTMHRAHAVAKDGHLEPWESHIHERKRVRECNAMPDL